MLRLAEVLAGWAPDATPPHGPIDLLEAGWPEIVGARVAAHTHPTRIADGALLVTTQSSAWSHQLSFLAEHILRAVEARLPGAGVERLRFRVGRLATRGKAPTRARRIASRRDARESPASATATEALARFRRDVEESQRVRRSAGWVECRGCGALAVPTAGSICAACAAARARGLTAATARLLFEAPWLGFAGTADLVEGLQKGEYERIRTELLRHWWGMLARARAAQRLSRDGRERLVASSYVLLQSNLPPEAIKPATVRSILGDELHDLLYGKTVREGASVDRQKRKA